MELSDLSDTLSQFEGAPAEVRAVVLCHCVAAGIVGDDDRSDLNGAIRRAELLLATGGDPRRPLELDGRAVASLAEDLDRPHRRAELTARLTELADELHDLPNARTTLAALIDDSELAWLGYAAAVLAEALSESD